VVAGDLKLLEKGQKTFFCVLSKTRTSQSRSEIFPVHHLRYISGFPVEPIALNVGPNKVPLSAHKLHLHVTRRLLNE
jgi:hypothetical protein